MKEDIFIDNKDHIYKKYNGDFIDLGRWYTPEAIDITPLGNPYQISTTDKAIRKDMTGYPSVYTSNTFPFTWKEVMKTEGKKEELSVELFSKTIGQEYMVYCKNTRDLAIDKILTTIAAVKGKLMFEIAPFYIKEIQCKMTPSVRKCIVEAGKKLKMYGKSSPIIASFDEYGNRLPDQIEIGNNRGILVKIVDPSEYGEAYFELKAIELPFISDFMTKKITKDYSDIAPWESMQKDFLF